jgi:hypothetical protein
MMRWPVHEVGLQELEAVADDECGEVKAGAFGDAGHGVGAEAVRQP